MPSCKCFRDGRLLEGETSLLLHVDVGGEGGEGVGSVEESVGIGRWMKGGGHE